MGSNSGVRTNVRVVVAGDRGTGKSSFIAAAASDSVPENVSPVLPPTRLHADFYPDGVPLTIIDTSSSLENKVKLQEELKRADVVVLTYACDQPSTLTRLTTYWLAELRRLEVKAPVILVGCKLDLRDELQPASMEQIMAPIMQQFKEIETCIECSAATQIQVPEVFYYAQKAVLHPTAPLFDQEKQSLKPRCINALRRIFSLCDHDMDGALNDTELNEFQVKCFNAPLQPAEIVGVKRVVQEKLPTGVNDRGLTLPGFHFLHALFIEKGRLETTWAVWRKFGYDDDLNLRADLLPVPSKQAPDQTMELSSEAMDFLRGVFRLLDTDNDGALRPIELDELFCTAPESPWDEAPYKDAAERTALGNLTLNGFLSNRSKKTLILREVPEDGVKIFLSNEEFLAACDVAVFVYDSSDENSWNRAKELLVEVASKGEQTGFGVPCLLIAAKDDLDPSPLAVQDSMRVCQRLGIEAPISLSFNLGDPNHVFHKIVNAAEHSYLGIPETERGRKRKQYYKLVNRSLTFISVGTAVAVIGVAAYRAYAARRNASN